MHDGADGHRRDRSRGGDTNSRPHVMMMPVIMTVDIDIDVTVYVDVAVDVDIAVDVAVDVTLRLTLRLTLVRVVLRTCRASLWSGRAQPVAMMTRRAMSMAMPLRTMRVFMCILLCMSCLGSSLATCAR